ncbi:MAG: DNA replication protein DnaC [Roseburia inulinivorans]|nr:DNA replication protein DnaC [Roseburia inulinivorans]
MALNNSQYDEIFRSYDAKQLKAQHQLEERTKAAYERSPELKALDASIAEISVASARRLLDGDSSALTELKAELKNLRTRKKALMKELSLPENYFEPVYECPDCKDTGYIDGKPCHCFKQQAIDLIYTQSNIKDILARENFSTLSLDYYSDSNVNPATGLTSLATAKAAVARCHEFVDQFDTTFTNLYFFGDTGIGKTFLSNCIAKELLDSGHSVIYFTAFQLFDILSKGVFEKDANAIATHQNIFDCDLLIIDDLGTELSNSFTTSQLFLCLNERILRQKSTIISTNLNMNQVADIYSERVLSRISNSYTIIKLFGDDIRLKKRIH